MAKHKIRLTIRPDVEIEVEGPELLDLMRQGLVFPAQPAAAPVAVDPPVDPAPQRASKTNNGGK